MVRQLFPTALIVAPINEAAALNATLRPIILARAEAAEGVMRSNRGGWQSAADFETWCGEPGRNLLALGRDLGGVQPERLKGDQASEAGEQSGKHARLRG